MAVLAVEGIRRHLARGLATVELVLQNTQKSKQSSKHGSLSLYIEPGFYLVLCQDHRHADKFFTNMSSRGRLKLAYLRHHRVAEIAAFVQQATIMMDCANKY